MAVREDQREEHRLRKKTTIMLVIVIVTNLAGNAALSAGLRHSHLMDSMRGVIHAATNPLVVAGVLLLIAWLTSQALVLSWADLSYVLPITGISYVLTEIVGALFLHETVTPVRWVATFLISVGVLLVAPTAPRTTPPE